jgi:hypothetical protein
MAGFGVNSICFEGARKWLAPAPLGMTMAFVRYVPYREVRPR